ncbi:hypothetical protein [Sphingomonas sp.]|uniref:hypothetical protein n=1 Tax=Sphingomonas sp. TaxID=28214 RepID=UPI003B000323
MRDLLVLIWAKLVSFANGFFLAPPNFAAAFDLLLLSFAALVRRAIRVTFHREHRIDLGNVLGWLGSGAVLVFAVLMAAATVFLSVKPVDVLGTLGIGSVAIGFAFKDILRNLVAGLLLLIQRPTSAATRSS